MVMKLNYFCIVNLLLLGNILFGAEWKCQHIINEVNSDTPQTPTTTQFVEFFLDCTWYGDDRKKKPINQEGLKILILKPLTGRNGFPVFETWVSLPALTSTAGYFVVGHPDLPEDKRNLSFADKFS